MVCFPVGGKSNHSPMWQRDGRVVSLLQKLQIIVENSKLSVVACPQPSLVSEKYMGTRMRMWGALADSKVSPLDMKQALMSDTACQCNNFDLLVCIMLLPWLS